LRATRRRAERDGQLVAFVSVDGRAAGVVLFEDPIRPDAARTVRRLREDGIIRIVMATGDRRDVAATVGAVIGVDEVLAEQAPEDKMDAVASAKRVGPTVMVGDGINDAPALAQADIGFAIGTGTDVAIEASDITLIKGSLRGVVTAIQISRATMRNVYQNLAGAFVYNTLGIPIALGVLYPFFGILLSPILGAAAMSFSSVTVISNANRLKRFRPSGLAVQTPREWEVRAT